MSVLDELKKQDELYKEDSEYINLESDEAISIMSKALCENIFSTILQINKQHKGGRRKTHGVVLFYYPDERVIKKYLLDLAMTLEDDKDYYYSYRRFKSNTYFTCYISDGLNYDSKFINEFQKPRVNGHIHSLYEKEEYSEYDFYDMVWAHESDRTYNDGNTKSGALMYTKGGRVFLFPHYMKANIISIKSLIFETKYIYKFNCERNIVEKFRDKVAEEFEKEGLTKSIVSVKRAEDVICADLKIHKRSFSGKKTFTGETLHCLSNATPDSYVLYFEVEW